MFNQINRISIKVTDFCNLDCIYCHQSKNIKNSSNTFKCYDKLYDFLMSLPLADEVDVLVTGGEISIRLDEFRKIEKILRRIESSKDIRFILSVVTNGTNLPAILKIVNAGRMRPDSVTVSWDGIYSYSKSRKGKLPNLSDDLFNNNIKLIVDNNYSEFINIAFAITPNTIDNMVDSLNYALDVGLRNFSFYYIHEASYLDKEFIDKFTNALDEVARIFVETYDKPSTRFRYFNWQNMYSRYRLSDASFLAKTSCVKLGNSIHIDIDGAVYPCTFFSDHKSMQIGHILEGFYFDRMELFKEEYFKKPTCNYGKCKNEHCFECPASNYITNKGMNNRTLNTCHLLDIEREIFFKYIDKINISDFDIKTFWSVGSSVVENHFDEKLLSIPNMPIAKETNYKFDDKMIQSDNLEVLKSW